MPHLPSECVKASRALSFDKVLPRYGKVNNLSDIFHKYCWVFVEHTRWMSAADNI